MGQPNPFRVMLTMEIQPGREREFEETWLKIGDRVAGHPANLGQWLVRSEDDASTYHVVSDWVDEESFREFERTGGHAEHRRMLQPLRFGGSMTTGTVLTYLPGSGSPTNRRLEPTGVLVDGFE
jgi:heme-degrading monooxygenase HmoA